MTSPGTQSKSAARLPQLPRIPWKTALLWILALVLIAYATSINGGFHFDDSHSVQSNIAVRSLKNIPSFWTDPRTSSFIPENRVYRPLVYTFYAFCWLAGGGKTWPFHIMKMVMHSLVCLALFLIWRRLWEIPGWFPTKSFKIKIPLISKALDVTPDLAALLLALIFAIHPATTECVDYIAATTSLQCAMFYLFAFVVYLRFHDTREIRFLLLSLFLFFLSVASKEEGITMPATILATEFCLAGGSVERRIRESLKAMLPYAGMAILLGGWIYIMHPPSGNESRGWVTPFGYFITQWREYLWYMRLWFWPWDLNADSASIIFSSSLTDPLVIQAAIGLFLLGLFAISQRKRFPAFLFGLVWYFITISPASSVVVLAEAVNEHRMYLSYIGFVGGVFTVLLWCAENFFAAETRAKRIGFAYVVVSIGLLIGTWNRNVVWSDDLHLWQDTVEKNPTSGRALNNLALVYLSQGNYKSAVDDLDKCEQYWATYMYCPLNKGIALEGLGDQAVADKKLDDAKNYYDRSEKSFQRAYDLDPRSTHANFHMAQFYDRVKKDYSKAAGLYKTAIDLTGGRYPEADILMANDLMRLHRVDEAMQALDQASSVIPDDPNPVFEKGRLLLDAGRVDDAVAAYRQLLARWPSHLQGWYNYGVAELSRGNLDEARKAFERTVALDPHSEQGWYNLAFVAEKMKDGSTALNAARTLASLEPGRKDFQDRVTELEKKFGNK